MTEYFANATLGFCWWDIPAFILLAAVVVYSSIRLHNLKKKRKELEEEMEQAVE